MARRFIPLTEGSRDPRHPSDQAYALVRSGDLPAIKVGGRGQWRVETVELEAYIQRMYRTHARDGRARAAVLIPTTSLTDVGRH